MSNAPAIEPYSKAWYDDMARKSWAVRPTGWGAQTNDTLLRTWSHLPAGMSPQSGAAINYLNRPDVNTRQWNYPDPNLAEHLSYLPKEYVQKDNPVVPMGQFTSQLIFGEDPTQTSQSIAAQGAPKAGPDNVLYPIPEDQALSAYGRDALAEMAKQGGNVLVPADYLDFQVARAQQTQAQTYQPPSDVNAPKADMVAGVPAPEWDKLEWWQKAIQSLPGGQMTAQSGIQGGVLGAISGAAEGAAAGAKGGLMGAGIGVLFASIFGEAFKQNPDGTFVNPQAADLAQKAMPILSASAMIPEQSMGVLNQLFNSIRDPEKYGPVGEVIQHIDDAYKAGALTYGVAFLPNEIDAWEANKVGPTHNVIAPPEEASPTAFLLADARRRIDAGESLAQIESEIRAKVGIRYDVQQLVGQSIFDLMYLVPGGEVAALGKLGKALNWKPLEEAMAMSASGHEGLMNTARLVREMPVEEASRLHPILRMVAGIDEAGLPKEFSPVNKASVLDRVFGMTPQSRATSAAYKMASGVDELFKILPNDETAPGAIRQALTSLRDTKPGEARAQMDGSPYPKFIDSSEGAILSVAMKDAASEPLKVVDAYDQTVLQRKIIQRMAQALSTPEKPVTMSDVIRMFAEPKGAPELDRAYRGVMQTIRENVDAGILPGAELDFFAEGGNNPLREAAKLFYGKDGAPFTPELLKLHVGEALAQSLEKWAVDWFNVKPMGWVEKVSNFVKSAQSMVLLNTPTFAMTNGLTNEMHLLYDGLLAINTQGQRAGWFTRMGFPDSMFRKGASAADQGEVGGEIEAAKLVQEGRKGYSLGQEIRDARQGKDWLSKTNQNLSKFSRKVTAFARLSQWMEKNASEVAYHNAMRPFWDGLWKAGDGFDSIRDNHPQLALYLDGINPDLVGKIEQLIANGHSRTEIEAALFNGVDKISVRDVLDKNDIQMLDHFPGLVEQIDKDLKTAKTPQDVHALYGKAKKNIADTIRKDTIRKARETVEKVVTKASVEGVKGVQDLVDQLDGMAFDTANGHFDRTAAVAEDLATGKYTEQERAIKWANLKAQENSVYNAFFDQEAAQWLGIYQALGADDAESAAMLAYLGNGIDVDKPGIHRVWKEFHDQVRDEFENWNALPKDMPQEARSAEWDALNRRNIDRYAKAIIEADRAQGIIDELGARLYERTTGRPKGEYQAWRDAVREVRRRAGAAQTFFRGGSLPPEMKSWLPAQSMELIRGYTQGQPLHLIKRFEREQINKWYYDNIQRGFITEQATASHNNAPGWGADTKPPTKVPPTRPPQAPQAGEAPKARPEPVTAPAKPSMTIDEAANVTSNTNGARYDELETADLSRRYNALNKVKAKTEDQVMRMTAIETILRERKGGRPIAKGAGNWETQAQQAVRDIESNPPAQTVQPETIPPVATEPPAGQVERRSPANLEARRIIGEELQKPEYQGMTHEEAVARVIERMRSAETDVLTGLKTRNTFMIDMAGLKGTPGKDYSFALFDIRGMKQTNDEVSHLAGDALLKVAAQLVSGEGENRAYRYGGDEFAVIVNGDTTTAETMMNAVKNKMQQLVLEVDDGSGNKRYFTGYDFHVGAGATFADADAANQSAHAAATAGIAGDARLRTKFREVTPGDTTPNVEAGPAPVASGKGDTQAALDAATRREVPTVEEVVNIENVDVIVQHMNHNDLVAVDTKTGAVHTPADIQEAAFEAGMSEMPGTANVDEIHSQAEAMADHFDSEGAKLEDADQFDAGIEAFNREMRARYPEQAQAMGDFLNSIAENYNPAAKDELLNNIGWKFGGQFGGEEGLNRFSSYAPSDEAQKAWQIARKFYGTTNDIREAGYVTPGGRMLDLSGRHYATGYEPTKTGYRPKPGEPDYLRGQRNVDHREVPPEFIDMHDFMQKSGAIRIDYASGMISISGPITADQATFLSEWFSHQSGWLEIDDPKTGRQLASYEFDGYSKSRMRNLLSTAQDIVTGKETPDILTRLDDDMATRQHADTVTGVTTFTDNLHSLVRIYDQTGTEAVATVAHEVTHAITPFMTVDDAATVRRWLKDDHGIDLPETWNKDMVPLAGKKGQYTTPHAQAYELLSAAVEKGLREGLPPTHTLYGVVERIKQWMTQVYRKIKGSQIDVKVSPEVEAMIQRWMGGETPPPVGTALSNRVSSYTRNNKAGEVSIYKIVDLPGSELMVSKDKTGQRRVATFTIPEAQRGKGNGQNMLLTALRDGDIYTESFGGVSDAYRRVQEAVVRKGLARLEKDELGNSYLTLSKQPEPITAPVEAEPSTPATAWDAKPASVAPKTEGDYIQLYAKDMAVWEKAHPGFDAQYTQVRGNEPQARMLSSWWYRLMGDNARAERVLSGTSDVPYNIMSTMLRAATDEGAIDGIMAQVKAPEPVRAPVVETQPAPVEPPPAAPVPRAIPQATATPVRKEYYIRLQNPDGSFLRFEKAAGKPVTVPGLEGMDFFIVKDGKTLNIDEGRTGILAISGTGTTQDELITGLIARVKKIGGKDEFEKLVQRAIEKDGPTPRYQNAEAPAGMLYKVGDEVWYQIAAGDYQRGIVDGFRTNDAGQMEAMVNGQPYPANEVIPYKGSTMGGAEKDYTMPAGKVGMTATEKATFARDLEAVLSKTQDIAKQLGKEPQAPDYSKIEFSKRATAQETYQKKHKAWEEKAKELAVSVEASGSTYKFTTPEQVNNVYYILTGKDLPGFEGKAKEAKISRAGVLFRTTSPETPAFREWFGDSKVVDENGGPLVVYHGTAGNQFDAFKVSRSDIGIHFGTSGQANDRIEFKTGIGSSQPEGVRLLPAYLSIKNPLRLDDLGSWSVENIAWGVKDVLGEEAYRDILRMKSTSQARKYLQDLGYDGIVYKNTAESEGGSAKFQEWRKANDEFMRSKGGSKNSVSIQEQKLPGYAEQQRLYRAWQDHMAANSEDSYIAFSPDQIKSTFNRGTFDPNDPNILMRKTKKPVENNAAANLPLGTAEQMSGPPTQDATFEAYQKHILPALDKAEQAHADAITRPTKFQFGDLSGDGQRELKRYLGTVYSQMADAKLATLRYGTARRDFALLPYEQRYGFDTGLMAAMPYEFWYTRSMVNWALRFIDKPYILSNYFKLQGFLNQQQDKGYPTRLKKKAMIPLPFLPDWMGEGIFFDPQRAMFPFLQLANPLDQFYSQTNQENKSAEGLLAKMARSGEITDAEYKDALAKHSGIVWNQALAQARQDVDGNIKNPIDFASAVSGMSLPLNLAYKFVTGRQDEIGMTPFAKMIQANTAAAGIGGPRGFNIEEPLRRAAGQPPIDRFEDYRVDRVLSNMAAEGIISADEASRAMIDRTGPAFTQAQQRVSQMGLWQYWGAPLGVDFFPEGEQEQRQLQKEYNRARDKWIAGDKQAFTKFFDTYPEYQARMDSLQKDPQQRLKQYLISEVWDNYMKLPDLYKRQMRDQLGEQFTDAFLSKDTRSYDSIDAQTLAQWAQAMGGNNPDMAPDAPKLNPKLASKEDAAIVQQYYDEQKKYFPNVNSVLSGYMNLPQEQQAQVRKQFPQIDKYYSWKNLFLAQHPKAIPWITSEQSELYGLPAATQQKVYAYRALKDDTFPGLSAAEETYYSYAKGSPQRSAFLKTQEGSMLKKYWDWQRTYAAANPDIASFVLSDARLSGAIAGTSYQRPITVDLNQFSAATQAQLQAIRYAGETIRPGAYSELQSWWEKNGKIGGDFKAFMKLIYDQMGAQ